MKKELTVFLTVFAIANFIAFAVIYLAKNFSSFTTNLI